MNPSPLKSPAITSLQPTGPGATTWTKGADVLPEKFGLVLVKTAVMECVPLFSSGVKDAKPLTTAIGSDNVLLPSMKVIVPELSGGNGVMPLTGLRPTAPSQRL